MRKKKKRVPVISPHFNEHVNIGGFNIKDGIFEFKDPCGNAIIPESITVGDGYTKESGKLKILNKINANADHINLNPNVNLQAFDWLFAVDTNTKKYKDHKVSISCSALFQINLDEPKPSKGKINQNWHCKVTMQSAFIFRNPTINPELIGWQELISRIKKSPEFCDSLKVGIIVDSELDKLCQINRHEVPLIGAHLLPDNFQLIYASSDAGREFPHNKIIKICDTTSNKIWNYLTEEEKILNNMEYQHNIFFDGTAVVSSAMVHKLSEYAT